MSAAGDIIAGKFRLERLVGRGSMGTVWSGRHLRLDMPVAIKFMEASATEEPEARQRFEREARAAAQIRSPHVVQVLDHGVDEHDAPYIVMELLEGEDLGGRLRRLGRMTPAEFEPLLTQAAKGLRRAHESGIVHRDLKPTNIFISTVDDEETVKLLDFGVAKVRWNALGHATQTGTLLGSPTFMSPEQARGHRTVDHRSDLWSLGVITFRAVTGLKPFTADSIAELIIKVCIEPAPVASQILPGLPPELDAFFLRAFQQDPEQRFQSALEMAAEFAAIARASAAGGAVDTPGFSPSASMPPDCMLPAGEPQSGAPSRPMSAAVLLHARAEVEDAVTHALAAGAAVPSAEGDAGLLRASAAGPSGAPSQSTPLPHAPSSTPRPHAPSSTPQPHSSPSNPRSSAPVLPSAVEAPLPALGPDADVALYQAGGLGGPVSSAAGPMRRADTLPLPEGYHPPSPGAPLKAPEAAAPGGPVSALLQPFQALPPNTRRHVATGAVVAAVVMTLLVLVVILTSGSDERQEGAAEATPAPSSAPSAAGDTDRPGAENVVPPGSAQGSVGTAEPSEPSPATAPTSAPTSGVEATTPAETPAPTDSSTPRPGNTPRQDWKRPSGTTKKASGKVDLGY
ncbi:serine/threonine protein kinase [Chondromyces apiculatus]|uniref:Serine/threonine-protein kinase Pkn1 n=1 Tax=Chondromyces apiculatus DSM 436 TaxID=1192034 RepID=A0A017TIR9_9BACT|nr:serine/threonine protein kinase [Chondromyces apiculatus]EYF08745.1 serine/threonine-protein kinase Pkn1 [Chondromyces apiculatus DSM 436]